MKTFRIEGELIVDTDIEHDELIIKLFAELKKLNIHFCGETKEIEHDIHK